MLFLARRPDPVLGSASSLNCTRTSLPPWVPGLPPAFCSPTASPGHIPKRSQHQRRQEDEQRHPPLSPGTSGAGTAVSPDGRVRRGSGRHPTASSSPREGAGSVSLAENLNDKSKEPGHARNPADVTERDTGHAHPRESCEGRPFSGRGLSTTGEACPRQGQHNAGADSGGLSTRPSLTGDVPQ